MKENVGDVDRNLRFIAGGALLAIAMMSRTGPLVRMGALLFGLSELITATTRYCPMNSLIGIDTNKTVDADEEPVGMAAVGGGPAMAEPDLRG